MKKELIKIFQVAVVFIGTVVGAGLASGKEITQFFTSFGVMSFISIIICGIFYIAMGTIISKIGMKYKLKSYGDVIHKISPNFFGKITGGITTIYLISSASIILAGSGALINQFFGLPKIVGTLIMMGIAIFFLFRGTNGLIEVNSFIVPTLIFTITTITILYFILCRDLITFDNILSFEAPKNKGLVLSTILYAGYNILCCSGVLVPLSTRIKNTKTMTLGVVSGALGLTILCLMINLLLTINQPYIYQYEIPLLFVSQRFSYILQALLLMVILLEMFSTEVSDVYSISKTLEEIFKMNFKKSVILVIFIAFPISLLGFGNLISTLYPLFGFLSLIFVFQCVKFYLKNRTYLNS